MRLVHAERRRPQVNITSLIDVLFLLLTFFLLTTSFIEQSALKVDLPDTEHGDAVQRERRFVLNVAEDGRLSYGGQEMDRPSLAATLSDAAEEINSGGGLTLRADRVLPYGDVMKILDLIKGAGIRRFVIASVESIK